MNLNEKSIWYSILYLIVLSIIYLHIYLKRNQIIRTFNCLEHAASLERDQKVPEEDPHVAPRGGP